MSDEPKFVTEFPETVYLFVDIRGKKSWTDKLFSKSYVSYIRADAAHEIQTKRADDFVTAMRGMQAAVHSLSLVKGWWDSGAFDELNAAKMALIHSEVSEALEELRKQEIDMTAVGIELADVVIRVMDFCEARGIDLGKAIVDKHAKNMTRTHRHGGKRF